MKVVTSEAGHGRGRGWLALLLVVVLVLVAGVWVVQTEGARQSFERWLSLASGLDVSVGSSRIGFPYVLVLEKVQSDDGLTDGPGFYVPEVRIGPGRRGICQIAVRRPVVHLVRAKGGRWEPSGLNRLGTVWDAGEPAITRLFEGRASRVAWRIDGGTVLWMDTEGQVIATAHDVDLLVSSARIEGHAYRHFRLVLGQLDRIGLDGLRDVTGEWLAEAGGRMVDLDGAPSPWLTTEER